MNIELEKKSFSDCGQSNEWTAFGSEVFGPIPICFNPSKHSAYINRGEKKELKSSETVEGIINTEI